MEDFNFNDFEKIDININLDIFYTPILPIRNYIKSGNFLKLEDYGF